MSPEETARTSCGCDGKRCSIFLDCPNPGSLVEKKKFSSTTGLRSTNTTTSTNNTAVTASISQCVPNGTRFFQTVGRNFKESRPDLLEALAESSDRKVWSRADCPNSRRCRGWLW